MKEYVAYYRVSTSKQNKSGLGLDAQRSAVHKFLSRNNHREIIAEYTEVESGKRVNRPQLTKAIEQCKAQNATLLIAKLDRLARNVAFIFLLKEELQSAGVDFTALDLPEANTMTLAIMAGFAQHERERISQRTKAGLAEARKRGVKLGKPENLNNAARKRGTETVKRQAKENKHVRHAYHFIKPLRDKGLSYAKIAEKLNEEGYTTRKGKQFYAWQVYNIYKRFVEA